MMTNSYVNPTNKITRYHARALSIIIAVLALIVFTPIIVAIFFYLYFLQKTLPIYGHERIGRNGKVFTCYKFRTMKRNASKLLESYIEGNKEAAIEWRNTQKLKNDPRILSRFCVFLRKTGLDELPQIFNIIRGDMDVVGPRPITRQELPRYGKYISHYCSVRPGLTGMWQVSGRNNITYAERVSLDVEYIKTATLYTDIIIIFKTAIQVATRVGY